MTSEPKTMKNFLEGMRTRSVILNRNDPAALAELHGTTAFSSRGFDFSHGGCKTEFAAINEEHLPAARETIKHALAEWEHYKANVDPLRFKKSDGIKLAPIQFQEKVAKARAKVELLSEESRALATMIKSHEARAAADLKAEQERLKGTGHVVMSKEEGGRIATFEGRAVKYNKAGEPVFADNGASVTEYRETLRKDRLQKIRERQERQRKLRQAINEAHEAYA